MGQSRASSALLFAGLLLLCLTLFGLAFLATRASPRALFSSDVPASDLKPANPLPTPIQVTTEQATVPAPNPALSQIIPVLIAMGLGALLVLLAQIARPSRRLVLVGCLFLGVVAFGFLLIGLLAFTARQGGAPIALPGSTATRVPGPFHPTGTVFFFTFPTPTPSLTPTGIARPTSAPVLTPVPVPALAVEAEYPTRMEINREDSIRVSLVPTQGQTFAPTIQVPGHAGTASTPIPIGTPGAPLGQALGSGYNACLTARLDAPAFSVAPAQQACLSPEQAQITWDWTLVTDGSGLEPGSTGQSVTAAVQVQWTPRQGGQTMTSELWRSRIEILVDKPLITIGQINVFTLLTGFIGSGLSVPFMYERFKERRGKKPNPEK